MKIFITFLCLLPFVSSADVVELAEIVKRYDVVAVVTYSEKKHGKVEKVEILKEADGLGKLLEIPRPASLDPRFHKVSVKFISMKKGSFGFAGKGFWVREGKFGKYKISDLRKLLKKEKLDE